MLGKKERVKHRRCRNVSRMPSIKIQRMQKRIMAVNCKCKKHFAEHSNMKSSLGITVRRNKKQITVKKNPIPNISITTNRYHHNFEQRLRKDRWVHHCFSSDFRMQQEDKLAQQNVVDGTESLASRTKSVMKRQSQLHIYKSSSLVGNKHHGKDL